MGWGGGGSARSTARSLGRSVGAGGIGFDVAEFLAHDADRLPVPPASARPPVATPPALPYLGQGLKLWPFAHAPLRNQRSSPCGDRLLGGAAAATPRTQPERHGFLREWGIDGANEARGGLLPSNKAPLDLAGDAHAASRKICERPAAAAHAHTRCMRPIPHTHVPCTPHGSAARLARALTGVVAAPPPWPAPRVQTCKSSQAHRH